MIIKTKRDLLRQAKKDRACEEGIEFLEKCKSIKEFFNTAPNEYIFWGLTVEYENFEEYINWEELSEHNWSCLLSEQPKFAKYCDWKKLDGGDWGYLLRKQSQFAKYKKGK